MGKRAPFRLVNTTLSPAGDDALVRALLAVGNAKPVEFTTGEGLGVMHRISAAEFTNLHTHFKTLLVDAVANRTQLAYDFPAADVLVSLRVRRIVVFGTRGWKLQYLPDFPTLRSALNLAVLLLLSLDAGKPAAAKPGTDESYGARLCRCQLKSCGCFYLAKKNPKGGPANRQYCTPTHRTEAHDSRENRSK